MFFGVIVSLRHIHKQKKMKVILYSFLFQQNCMKLLALVFSREEPPSNLNEKLSFSSPSSSCFRGKTSFLPSPWSVGRSNFQMVVLVFLLLLLILLHTPGGGVATQWGKRGAFSSSFFSTSKMNKVARGVERGRKEALEARAQRKWRKRKMRIYVC